MNNIDKLKELTQEMLEALEGMEEPKEEGWLYCNGTYYGHYVYHKEYGLGYFVDSTGKTASTLFANDIYGKEGTERPATREEIEKVLSWHALEKGFVEGAKFKSAYSGCFNTISPELTYDAYYDFMRTMAGACVFYKGKWAELVEKPLTIAGHEVEIYDDYIKIGCTKINRGVLENFYRVAYEAVNNEIPINEETLKELKEVLEK